MKSTNLLWASASLCVAIQTANAEERVINFSIPPQSAVTALDALAAQSDLQMLFNREALKNSTTQGLSGSFTAREALKKLLVGTGLTYTFTAEDAVAIKLAPTQINQSDPTTLPTVKVTADATVYEDDPKGYNVTHTFTATKTDTPIMETPLNIQVVSQQVMKDQQAVRIEKALENVSGVNFISQGVGGASFNIRGFDTLSYYRDGVRVDTQVLNTVFPDVAPLEQIQVLKGPASILYGRLEPGGLINLVSKQPLSTPYYSMQQQFGSFDFYRTTMDATGPVSKDKTLLYRLNMAYENAGSFNQYAGDQRVLFAPVIHWNISDQTQANFHLQYMHSMDHPGGVLPAVGNRPASVPLGLNLGESSSITKTDDIRVGFDWSHDFNSRWTLRQNFNVNLVNNPVSTMGIQGLVDPTNCTAQGCAVARTYFNTPALNSQAYYTSLNLTGKIDTWNVAHTLLMGWDYLVENSFQAGSFNSSTTPTIDLYNPVHSGTDGLLNTPDYAYSWKFGENWHGLFVQDQMKLPFNLNLLAGFRYDSASQSNTYAYTIPIQPTSSNSENVGALKPRFGIVWQALPELSLYGNYVENFGLTNGHNVDGSLLAPTTAEQKEIGVKTELFDKRFTGSVAWFDLTKQHLSTPNSDPALAAQGFSSTTGEVRNQGLEVDFSGEIWPSVKMIGSYAYINSRITKDVGTVLDSNGNVIGTNSGNQGNRYWGVPTHGGSLWTTYEPQDGDLRGFKFGVGIVARGERQGDNANSYQLPGYAILNLMTGYSWKVGASKISLQLNADNLLDKTYYNPYSGSGRNYVFASPRSFLGSIRLEF
ncbi:TonB-dependent receptor [Methylomonas sp. AM2-LC]|uniref:TonB-dependent siderophore receptor n=1 Tax=Methylomonas sp. AM2-LC TaxID=3153301 RepID=UPI0032679198